MYRFLLICATVLAGHALAAETYKWVDERGVTNYGEKPPAGRAAKPVDTSPGGTIESGGLPQKKYEADLRRQAEAAAPPPVAAAAPAAPPVRGMDFSTFIRLQRGMTEGELVLRAGPPDHESVENFRNDIVKSYYYYPTSSNPQLTVVTLRRGRIVNIERERKIF